MQGCDAMKLTIHDGELARYLVHCKHAGKPKRAFVPYESDVLVFAMIEETPPSRPRTLTLNRFRQRGFSVPCGIV